MLLGGRVGKDKIGFVPLKLPVSGGGGNYGIGLRCCEGGRVGKDI